MRLRVTQRISTEVDRLEALRTRPVLANPVSMIDSRAEELSRYVVRSEELIGRRLERAHIHVAELAGQLRALSPQRTLERGYAIAQLPDGTALRDASSAPAGTALLLTVASGSLTATVDEGR